MNLMGMERYLSTMFTREKTNPSVHPSLVGGVGFTFHLRGPLVGRRRMARLSLLPPLRRDPVADPGHFYGRSAPGPRRAADGCRLCPRVLHDEAFGARRLCCRALEITMLFWNLLSPFSISSSGRGTHSPL